MPFLWQSRWGSSGLQSIVSTTFLYTFLSNPTVTFSIAASVYKKYEKETGDTTKTVIASTASPYKFTRSVMNAIDSSYDSKTDFELIDELEKLSGVKVPQAIEDIRSAAVLHDTVCETEDMCKEVKKILNIK